MIQRRRQHHKSWFDWNYLQRIRQITSGSDAGVDSFSGRHRLVIVCCYFPTFWDLSARNMWLWSHQLIITRGPWAAVKTWTIRLTRRNGVFTMVRPQANRRNCRRFYSTRLNLRTRRTAMRFIFLWFFEISNFRSINGESFNAFHSFVDLISNLMRHTVCGILKVEGLFTPK